MQIEIAHLPQRNLSPSLILHHSILRGELFRKFRILIATLYWVNLHEEINKTGGKQMRREQD